MPEQTVAAQRIFCAYVIQGLESVAWSEIKSRLQNVKKIGQGQDCSSWYIMVQRPSFWTCEQQKRMLAGKAAVILSGDVDPESESRSAPLRELRPM